MTHCNLFSAPAANVLAMCCQCQTNDTVIPCNRAPNSTGYRPSVRPSVRFSAHPLALLASEKFRRGKLCQTRHKMTGKCLLNDASETQKGTPAGFVPSLPRFASPVPHATPSMPRICQCGLHCQRRRLVLLLLRLRLLSVSVVVVVVVTDDAQLSP